MVILQIYCIFTVDNKQKRNDYRGQIYKIILYYK